MWKISPRSSIELGALLLIVTIPAGLGGAGAVETASAALSGLAREVLSDPGYQTEWPSELGDAALQVPVGIGLIANLLIYIGFAVAIVLIAVWAFQEFSGMFDSGDKATTDRALGGTGDARGPGLLDPERLARQGRYAEAIHQLLLAAIWRLGQRLEQPPSPSTTSRELARRLPLDRDGREAFEFIVRTVELSLFGGQQVGADEYALCRRRYEALVVEAFG